MEYSGFNGTPHQTVPAKAPGGRDVRVFLDTGYGQSRIARGYAGPKETPLLLSIGGTTIESSKVVLLDGDVDARITSPGKDDIVVHATLGWDVLRRYVLELSPRHHRLRLSTPR